MNPLLSAHEARAMDAHAVTRLAMTSLVLMENAGRGAAERIIAMHGGSLGHVVVVGGIGQNGGDAWVVARHLIIAGYRTTSLLVSMDGRAPKGDAAANFATLRAMGASIETFDGSDDAVLALLERATLVVDGIFGTGLSRAIDPKTASVIDSMNVLDVPIVALDLPSGIDADTGSIHGAAVRATRTVTFGHAKRGLFQAPGGQNVGMIDVVSIGSPLPKTPDAFLLEPEDLRELFPPRRLDSHKGTAGHVLVVAGDAGMPGAALLAARGAARAGAGLVTIAARPAARPSIEARVLEWMAAPFDSAEELLALTRGKRSLVIGPGLGRSEAARQLVERIAETAELPVVVDADALTLLGPRGLERLGHAHAPRVITPHPGEAATLLGVTNDAVQRDRHAAAHELAKRGRCTVVLKGMGSIISAPDEPDYVCPRGTPAMGTGGSGDVLAGVVAAVVRPETAHRVVAAAVLLHAMAGEHAAEADRGLLASEIADAIPAVLRHAGRPAAP